MVIVIKSLKNKNSQILKVRLRLNQLMARNFWFGTLRLQHCFGLIKLSHVVDTFASIYEFRTNIYIYKTFMYIEKEHRSNMKIVFYKTGITSHLYTLICDFDEACLLYLI